MLLCDGRLGRPLDRRRRRPAGAIPPPQLRRLIRAEVRVGPDAVRYPEVPVIFASSRRFADERAYRFLGAAAADRIESS